MPRDGDTNAHESIVLVTTLAPGIIHLQLNRPQRRNAFTLEMFQAVERAVFDASASGARTILLSGAGPVFSAGGDVKMAKELLSDPERFDGYWELLMASYSSMILALRSTQAVTICALEGAAVGAGLSLALATDLRVAGEGFRFIPGWLQRGTPPDGGGSYFLARALGAQAMLSLILLGREISSADALARGLVDEVVDDGSALKRAAELAEELADRSGPALPALRRLADMSTRQGLADQLVLETDLLRDVRKSSQRQRGLSE